MEGAALVVGEAPRPPAGAALVVGEALVVGGQLGGLLDGLALLADELRSGLALEGGPLAFGEQGDELQAHQGAAVLRRGGVAALGRRAGLGVAVAAEALALLAALGPGPGAHDGGAAADLLRRSGVEREGPDGQRGDHVGGALAVAFELVDGGGFSLGAVLAHDGHLGVELAALGELPLELRRVHRDARVELLRAIDGLPLLLRGDRRVLVGELRRRLALAEHLQLAALVADHHLAPPRLGLQGRPVRRGPLDHQRPELPLRRVALVLPPLRHPLGPGAVLRLRLVRRGGRRRHPTTHHRERHQGHHRDHPACHRVPLQEAGSNAQPEGDRNAASSSCTGSALA